MRELKKIIVFALVVVFIASMLFIGTSCKQEAAPAEEAVEEAAPAKEESVVEPVTLNILVEGGGKLQQEDIAKKFEEETGNIINLVEVPYVGVYDKFLAETAAGSSNYDIVTLDVIWLPTFAQFCEPLDDLFTDEVINDFFPTLVTDAQYEGKFVGLPAWTNAEILFYQKDLFEDSKEQADFKAEYGYDLKVPENWQEFTDAAKFFTRDTNGDGEIDLYGTDVKGGVDTEWMATALQAGSPGAIFDADGNVIIDNQAHVDALKFYTDLHLKHHVSPVNVNELDWGISSQLFWEGKLAMFRWWAHLHRLTPEDSVVYGNVGAAPMIAGPGGIGAIPGPWYNVIPTTSKNKDVAKQFLKFAYENNVMGMDSLLGLAARISAYESYADKEGFEHIDSLIETLSSPQTIGRAPVKHWQEVEDEVLIPNVLQKVLSGEASAEEVLDEAKLQIEQIMK